MNKRCCLSELDNYRPQFQEKNLSSVLTKYIEIVCMFVLHAGEKIVLRNNRHYLFILARGLETLLHCFRFVLLYTRNTDLALCHCKKACYYYAEFIQQIGQDSNSFLRLTSKDATLFVYKKTIFGLDTEVHPKEGLCAPDLKQLELMSLLPSLLHKIMFSCIKIELLKGTTKTKAASQSLSVAKAILAKLLGLENDLVKLEIVATSYSHFLDIIETQPNNVAEYRSLALAFLRKASKNPPSSDHLNRHFYSLQWPSLVKRYSPNQFVNWLLSD